MSRTPLSGGFTVLYYAVSFILIVGVFTAADNGSPTSDDLGRITSFEVSTGFLSTNCKISTTRGTYLGQGGECADLRTNATLRKYSWGRLYVPEPGDTR